MDTRPTMTRLPGRVALLAGAMACVSASHLAADELSLSQTPLFVQSGVEPNILVTLDDSGSMEWAYAPDSLDNYKSSKRFKSADFNPMYYNPDITYKPGLDADGKELDTSFDNASRNPYNADAGTVDLRTEFRPIEGYDPDRDDNDLAPHATTDEELKDLDEAADGSRGVDQYEGTPAYYYVYDETLSGCNSNTDNDDCYRLEAVKDAEKQNFANWYSFHRSRNLSTITGISRAFGNVDDDFRVAWQALNTCEGFSGDCKGWDSSADSVDPAIDVFDTDQKSDFYEWLQRLPANSGTPLRDAFIDAGEYLETDAPYESTDENGNAVTHACRTSYHVAMTDGIWNGSIASGEEVDNADSTETELPDGTTYNARAPYKDDNSDSVADIAFHYWATDLQDTIDDEIEPFMPVKHEGDPAGEYWDPRNDPATWQHMVNFVVGLGLGNTLDNNNLVWGGSTFAGDFANIEDGSADWPDGTQSNASPDNVYDLWHAAVNSRGQFFSAENPDSLSKAFASIINRIKDRSGSAAAVATNSGSISDDTRLYQAKFRTTDWSGDVVAFNLDASEGTVGDVKWKASEQIPLAANREIITSKRVVSPSGKVSEAGVAFDWSNLSTAQKTALDDNENKLEYLRGDQSVESKPDFRNRPHLLGDIVHSAPVFVGAPPPGIPEKFDSHGTETVPHRTFRSNHTDRAGVIYAGANDGMLHAFRADTGEELLAYVPQAVYDNLADLTDNGYTHKYYVDGAITAADAFFDGDWHTIVTAGLNAGGQGVYALDVTNPGELDDNDNFTSGAFSESNADDLFLWEFTDEDDADLGYTFSQPVVARLNNGKWGVIVGNGYNNTDSDGNAGGGTAVLYILDAEDGSVLAKLDTGEGGTSAGETNGLSSPFAADADGDQVADFVYAGDLEGNLWKFDLSADDETKWNIGSNGSPLFQAAYREKGSGKGGSTVPQPITSAPTVGPGPKAGTLMVYVGTGKYVETGLTDKNSTDVQSFYALVDTVATSSGGKKGGGSSSGIDRADLLRQSITDQRQVTRTVEGVSQEIDIRVTSNHPFDATSHSGWFMDLLPEDKTDNAEGERVVSQPLVRNGRVVFNTLVPNSDPCAAGGGTGWIMELDATSGKRLDRSPFDLDGDRDFDNDDLVSEDGTENGTAVAIGGRKLDAGGIPTAPAVFTPKGTDPNDPEVKVFSTSTGEITTMDESQGAYSTGRQSWRQIR